jgi:hypothetical protein
MQLQLVVADLHLDREALDAAPAGALARLPGLEALLRWGRPRPAVGDWRAFVAACADRADLSGLPPARVVASAAGVAASGSPWLAAPVHMTAGLDHLRLHSAGLLRLEDDERDALVNAFNRDLGGDGLRLHAVPGGLLVTGADAVQAQTQDPARFLGADVRTAPAQGADAASLRRLGAEIEMWLFGSAAELNRRRSRRGALPVNALWLWGGGAAAEVAQRDGAPGPRLHGDDAVIAGIAALAGLPNRPVPADLQALHAEADASADAAVQVICLSAAPTGPGDAPLARLDARWFAPARSALRDGRMRSLGLYVGGQQYRLRRTDGWQFWHRARPWWETLGR